MDKSTARGCHTEKAALIVHSYEMYRYLMHSYFQSYLIEGPLCNSRYMHPNFPSILIRHMLILQTQKDWFGPVIELAIVILMLLVILIPPVLHVQE